MASDYAEKKTGLKKKLLAGSLLPVGTVCAKIVDKSLFYEKNSIKVNNAIKQIFSVKFLSPY
jgi:hypothetical protein